MHPGAPRSVAFVPRQDRVGDRTGVLNTPVVMVFIPNSHLNRGLRPARSLLQAWESTMSTPPPYIGIDVAKAELVVATGDAELFRVPNTPAGHRDLVERLRPLNPAAVVMESTGPYGREAATALSVAGFQVAVVQPGRVRNFAASLGIRAKTDPIDARVIARFAAATKPRCFTPPSTAIAQLRALNDRRDQIIEMRIQEENHLESVTDTIVAKELRDNIKRLKSREKDYTKRMAKAIAQQPELERMSTQLQQEAGVGLQTAVTLMTHCPELGTLNRQQIAALAGLAPYDRSSGTQNGKRAIFGGRKRLRCALYLAAVTASRCSDWLKPIYDKLKAAGKCPKLAHIACARKLLVRLNTLAAALLHSDQEGLQKA